MTVLVSGLLWRGAAGVASRLGGRVSPLDRVAATLALSLMQVIAVLTALAAAGLLERWTVVGTSVAVSATLIAWTRGAAWWPGPTRARLAEVARIDPLAFAVLLPAVVAAALALMFAIPRPPLEVDPLGYHLLLAARFLQAHDLSVFHFPLWNWLYSSYAFYPVNGDLLSTWVLALFGCDFLLPFVNLPTFALLGLSAYGILRDAGLGRAPSVAASAALCTVPMAFRLLTESWVEPLLWAAMIGSARFMILSARSGAGLFAIAAGLAGIAVGTKQTGMVFLPVALLFHVASPGFVLRPLAQAARRLAKAFAILAAAVLLLGSSSYLRNWVVTGSPLHPFPVTILGVEVFPGRPDGAERMSAMTVWAWLGFLWDSGRLRDAFVGLRGTAEAGWGFGATGVLALVAGVAGGGWVLACTVARRRSAGLAPLVGAVVLLAMYVTLPLCGGFLAGNMRFAWPGVAMALVAGATFAAEAGVPDAVTAGVFVVAQLSSLSMVAWGVGAHELWLGGEALGGGLAFAGLAAIAGRSGRMSAGSGRASRFRRAWLALAVAALATWGAAALHEHRGTNRIRYWTEATLPHQQVVGEHVRCFDALERAVPAGRVAVGAKVNGSLGALWPLVGSHLEREVLYVDVGGQDDEGRESWQDDDREHPDRDAWLRRLSASRPDALFLYLSRAEGFVPPEADWVRAMPERFEAVLTADLCEVWRVR